MLDCRQAPFVKLGVSGNGLDFSGCAAEFFLAKNSAVSLKKHYFLLFT